MVFRKWKPMAMVERYMEYNECAKTQFHMLTRYRRLLTRDRLAKMGICEERECLSCGCKPESIEHIFFECEYSMKCLMAVLEWIYKELNWREYGGDYQGKPKGRSVEQLSDGNYEEDHGGE
uniref:Reverse transcriptase zinc-binding domain-containing protein n=1 Tax=Solanum lycopersicum TaxID=4081 RepID=A0A3Q7FJ25_SOLLC